MIRKFTIKNYKSILDHEIELGRLNVFIGENGSGKSNILEAVAMAAAALTNKLNVEEIYARGIRVAKPSLTFSSFTGTKLTEEILVGIEHETPSPSRTHVELSMLTEHRSAAEVRWFVQHSLPSFDESILALDAAVHDIRTQLSKKDANSEEAVLLSDSVNVFAQVLNDAKFHKSFRDLLGDFAIYNPHILSLRGIQNVSRRTPLGIHGENLDVAFSAMADADREALIERARCISWLDDILIDAGDELKHQGHKFGRSTSTLYFRDRFMHEENNLFSAENTNEGILHILFYLVLFASAGTPKVFGIDNIETALNPQLCRDLIKQLAELSKVHGKQALITTHNPAILDGLNLHDDEQRLFVVSRNDEGHTVTERIRIKPETKDGKFKLSELWMRGHLGGIPQRF